MRWGEPNKVPPLTRSRGMFAASSLVVAVLATYASVAVLSLSAAAPFSIVGHLPGVDALVKGIGWTQPTVDGLGVKLDPHRSRPAARCSADVSVVDFGQTPAARHAQSLQDHEHDVRRRSRSSLRSPGTSAASVTAHVRRVGSTATTACRSASTRHDHPDDQSGARPARSTRASRSPCPSSGLAPKIVQISGAQAPLAPWPCHRHSGGQGGRRPVVDAVRPRSAASPGTSSSALPQGRARSSRSAAMTHRHDHGRPDERRRCVLLPGRTRSRSGSAAASEPAGPGRAPRRPTRRRPQAPRCGQPAAVHRQRQQGTFVGAGRPSHRTRRRATRSR